MVEYEKGLFFKSQDILNASLLIQGSVGPQQLHIWLYIMN